MVIKILNKKCYTSSIAKDFFFSFSKHTTHIHLKSSTPSTLKSQRHKHIKIQNKNFFFFQQFNRLLLFNSINCTIVQDFFFSLYLNSLRPQRSFFTLQFLHFSPLESLVLPPLKIASAEPVLSKKNHYSFVLSFSPPIK